MAALAREPPFHLISCQRRKWRQCCIPKAMMTVATNTDLTSSLCTNPVAQQALLALEWYNKSFHYQSLARTETLNEMLMIRLWSKCVAIGSTGLFSLSVAFLISYVVWRLIRTDEEAIGLHRKPSESLSADQIKKWIDVKALATKHLILCVLLGQFYFVALSFLLSLSARSIQNVVDDFRLEHGEPTVEVSDVPTELGSPRDIYGFISSVSEDIRSIPEAFALKSAFVPSQARWWTLGWDELALVDFRVEATRALLKRSEIGTSGTQALLPLVREKCQRGRVEI